MKHILLQRALKYKKRVTIDEPIGFSFDSLAGAWVNILDRSFLIEAEGFKGLGTKKNDIETGEDQKGQ